MCQVFSSSKHCIRSRLKSTLTPEPATAPQSGDVVFSDPRSKNIQKYTISLALNVIQRWIFPEFLGYLGISMMVNVTAHHFLDSIFLRLKTSPRFKFVKVAIFVHLWLLNHWMLLILSFIYLFFSVLWIPNPHGSIQLYSAMAVLHRTDASNENTRPRRPTGPAPLWGCSFLYEGAGSPRQHVWQASGSALD